MYDIFETGKGFAYILTYLYKIYYVLEMDVIVYCIIQHTAKFIITSY
jgi:hypothetical protein